MKPGISIYAGCLLAIVMLAGCLKGVDPQSYSLTVTFASKGDKYVSSDITVNPKDSIILEFTVTSPKNMKYVTVQKNGSDFFRDTLTSANKNSFTVTKRFVADTVAGAYNIRVLARDSASVFLGDKSIIVTVTPDFDYYTQRTLFVPDTTAKTNPTYFATSTGATFSYSGVGTNSGLIDFGYVYDTTSTLKHTIYSLNTSPVPSGVNFYDISTWTKNATVFKKITTPTFANITSGGILRSAGLSNLSSGTSTKITSLAAGNVILFKTAAGKYGAIQINYIKADSPAATSFMIVDVKVQR